MKPFRVDLETVFLIIVATILLTTSLGTLWDHTLKHDYPLGYLASDSFQHQTRAEGIKTIGTYQTEPPWIAAGFTDVVGFYPSGYYYLSIPLSYVSGLEVYDTLYIIGFLWGALAALLSYFIIRKFNKHVAILSLPFMLFIFSGISMVAFTWGATPAMIAQTFLILSVWMLSRMEVKYSWAPLALALSAIILSHGSETIITGAFIAAYLALQLVRKFVFKENRMAEVINTITGGALFVFLSMYSLAIVLLIFAHAYPFQFSVVTQHLGFPDFVHIEGFGIFSILIGIGLIASSVYLIKKRSDPPLPLLFGVYMFIVGYGNYFGLDYRAFQVRYFWPIYLSIFIGFALYLAFKLVAKKVSVPLSIGTSAVLFLVILAPVSIPLIPHVQNQHNPGIMNDQHWEILNWLRENTPKDAEVFFFYGEVWRNNAVLRNIERVHYLIMLEELENAHVRRDVLSAKLGDCCGTGYPYWKNFLNPGFHWEEGGSRDGFYKRHDVCTMDYYVFDRVASPNSPFPQFNAAYANAMSSTGQFTVAFENQYSVILKNLAPGENCLEKT